MVRGGLGRRGMSPLIATVLLMAFAVALGGVIINIRLPQGGDCEKIRVTRGMFCVHEGSILLRLLNTEESVPLQGLKIDYVEGGVQTTLLLKDSALGRGQQSDEMAIKAPVAPGTKVNLLGVIGDAANPITCEKPIDVADPLGEC